MACGALVLVAVLALAGACSATTRIQEWDITLSVAARSNAGIPIVDPPKRTAGYFKLDRTHDARLFYFFFASRTQSPDDPVVLWMTGGPGCGSEVAAFWENGPFKINNDLSLSETEFGWDTNSNMIFVDQPVDTGFSYTDDPRDIVHDEVGVADDMLDFLQEFFEAHPDLAGRDFFITGESYAGHYVPAVSHRVWLAKRNGEGKPINIKGLAIGNGLTDPAIQYGAYADYAYLNKLISKPAQTVLNLIYPICRVGAELCNATHWDIVCDFTWQFCNGWIVSPIIASQDNINVYDIRKPCVGRLCYDFDKMDKLLALPDVRKALGVGSRPYQECNMDVYFNMIGDWMIDYDQLLPELLADGLRVIVYAGEYDLLCNWLGNRRWVDVLPWHGAETWSRSLDAEWMVGGEAAGLVREVDNLAFVRVFKAGHMAPMDQPRNMLDLVTRLTRGKQLLGSAPQ